MLVQRGSGDGGPFYMTRLVVRVLSQGAADWQAAFYILSVVLLCREEAKIHWAEGALFFG